MRQPNSSSKDTAKFNQRIENAQEILMSHWNHVSTGKFENREIEQIARAALELCAYANKHDQLHVADIAKAIEHRVNQVTQKRRVERDDDVEIRRLISSLLRKENLTNVIPLRPNLNESKTLNIQANGRTVGIFCTEEKTRARLEEYLQEEGYQTESYSDIKVFKAALAEDGFDLAIIDILMPNCPLASATSVEDFLSNKIGHTPILMLCEGDDVSTRLIALRAGIKAHITKPINKKELIKKVDNIISKREENTLRVLVVDDDRMLTEFYDTALTEEGFTVKTLNDPLKILSAIEEFKPDVITLDYLMPGCNGLEAAELLRGDPRYMTIPLVFMSASEEAVQRRGVMNIFGNSFLEKPVDIDEITITLKEITAKSRKIAHEIEKVSVRSSAAHLQNHDFFLHELEHTEETNNTENITYLALATIDDIDSIRDGFGSLNLLKIEEAVEKFLATHPRINGHGCKFGEHRYLLKFSDDIRHDSNHFFETFKEEFTRQTFHIGDLSLSLSINLGVLPLNQSSPRSLEEKIKFLERANAAATRSGGENIAWAQPDTRKSSHSEKLVTAVKARSFQLAFQSIVRPNYEDHIFEAQVRLRDADGELHHPASFLPILEDLDNDSSYQLDRWVIENAFKALENTSGRGASEFSIVIKLTPDIKQIERLLPFIYNINSNSRLRGSNRIYFSIPEQALINHLESAKAIVAAFKTAGCGFILDRCQCNDRSLELIRELPRIDFVKLAPEVGRANASKVELKKTIVKLEDALDNRGALIAGLVEDAKIFAQFWDLNVRYFQGYFIHRPHESMVYSSFEEEDVVMER